MNDFWRTFGGGLLTGILGEIILALLGWIIVKAKSSSLLKIISSSKLFGHGIEYVYPSHDKAVDDMKIDIDKSAFVKIMCIRGRSFIQADEELSYVMTSNNKNIKFLLSSPTNTYIDLRANEIGKPPELYRKEIENNLQQLFSATIGLNNIEKKIHNEPPIFRLIIMENRIYFSFFKESKMGTQLQVFRAKSNSSIYKGLNRYYDYVWNTASDMEESVMRGNNNETVVSR